MKIRSIISVLLGIIMLGAGCLYVFMANQNHKSMEEAFVETQLQTTTENISEKLVLEMDRALVALETTARHLAKEEQSDRKEIRETLKSLSTEMKFSDMNLCDKDGTGYDLNGKEQKVSFCSYYNRALLGVSSVAFSSFYEDSTTEDLVFTVPISQDGTVIGVLRASIDLEYLRGFLSIDTFRGKENVHLLQKNGTILAHLTRDLEESEGFLELLDKEDDNYKKIQQVIEQGKPFLAQSKLQNKEYYISFQGIKRISGGGVMISIPKEQLLALYEKQLNPTGQRLSILLSLIIFVTATALVGVSLYESFRRHRTEALAYYDEITESMNFNRFRKEASLLLQKSIGNNYAIIVVAIDRFEYIKEFFGVSEGHRILKYISQMFKENIKTGELSCRLNTDNFVLLLKYHNKEELSNRISYLDVTIGNFEEKSIKMDKYELRFHYGIYCNEDSGTDIDIMINRATHALNQVKNDKKQTYEYYSGAMEDRILDEKEIEDRMYTALEEKEFIVYLQPKYDLNSGLQVGAEALVRWMHPDKGLMYPGRFIGVFEKNGFIVKLDMYILEILCHRLKVWISKGYRPMPLSINISRLNLFDEYFIDNVEAILEKYGIPANLIQLEIAEEVVSDNMELLSSLMERLKKDGFLISMDDFGTGTTSMNTLYHVPVDELKLDRKFLLGAEKTDRGKNVIKSIIEMAKRLDIKVVSEGVENKAQARMLKELGCDMIQGYVFSDPLPIKEYENYAYGPRAKDNKIW